MRYTRRQYPATHKPPTAASVRGLEAAMRVLYSGAPMTAEEAAAFERQAACVPYRRRQGDLALCYPAEPTD